jgi:hypothetical protein
MAQRRLVLAVVLALAGPTIVAVGQTCPYSEPPSDWCDSWNARVIPGNPGQHVVMMDVTNATGSETLCGVWTGHTVWFQVTPTVNGPIVVSTCHPATTYDTVLQVFYDGDVYCQGMTPGPCSDDVTIEECNNGCSSYGSIVTFDAIANQTYRFGVGSYHANQAGCLLCLGVIVTIGQPCGSAPTNLVCQTARELPGTPGTYEDWVDTTDVTIPPQDWPCSTNVGHIVWFRMTPTVSGPLTFTTCTPETTYDTVVEVVEWADEPCTGMAAMLRCVDDTPDPECSNACGLYRGSTASLNVVAGATLYFKVGAYNNNSAGCVLCLGVRATLVDLCATETTPPIAAIEVPAPVSCVCDSVNVLGSADDPDGTFEGYTLDCQSAGGGAWTLINFSTTPVSGGLLGTWDATDFPEGYYVLRLTATNICGMTSTDVRVVWHDEGFDSFLLEYPPNGTVVSGTICVEGTIWDSCFAQYTVLYRAMEGGSFQPVDPNHPVYTGSVINEPLAWWDTTTVGNGDYLLLITATTVCGHEHREQRFVTVDNQPPDAYITSPWNCTRVGGMLYIYGTAYDDHLAGWSLMYTGGYANTWVQIASGTDVVIGGQLGRLDTSNLLPCAYTLRLIVSDAAIPDCNSPGRSWSEFLVSVPVGLVLPGDINCDGLIDFGDINPFVHCLSTGDCNCP